MKLSDMERVAMASDLTVKGDSEEIRAVLGLLTPGKNYYAFFVPMGD